MGRKIVEVNKDKKFIFNLKNYNFKKIIKFGDKDMEFNFSKDIDNKIWKLELKFNNFKINLFGIKKYRRIELTYNENEDELIFIFTPIIFKIQNKFKISNIPEKYIRFFNRQFVFIFDYISTKYNYLFVSKDFVNTIVPILTRKKVMKNSDYSFEDFNSDKEIYMIFNSNESLNTSPLRVLKFDKFKFSFVYDYQIETGIKDNNFITIDEFLKRTFKVESNRKIFNIKKELVKSIYIQRKLDIFGFYELFKI